MIARTLVRLVATVVVLYGAVAHGTSIAPVTIHDLFKEADVVAVVHVISGDDEIYPIPVYRVRVTEALKGVTEGSELFFGGCTGISIGQDYLLFLNKGEGVVPNKPEQVNRYGQIRSLYRIMYAGYSAMEIDYACVFDGTEPKDRCQYAAKLNPEQVLLPKTIRTFPAGDAGPITNYKKWVRESELLGVLQRLAHES